MRRWNGWGEESTLYELAESAGRYLAALVGEGLTLPDATWQRALSAVPASRLKKHALVSTDKAGRLRHARGQSLPDWVALRSGRVGVYPDGVAYPASDKEISLLMDYAGRTGARLIPYGGGTSVVGHINPLPGAPVLTVDLSRLNRLLDLDETSRLATFETGIPGPQIEAALNPLGYTLGHYPQSFEYSTLGGWVATRSSGQQSYYYGRIEDLFAGGHVETPVGALELPPYPASAAGPDLRHALLGSEGRMGILTRAVVRVRPLPQCESFYGVFFHTWEQGAAAVQAVAQAGIPVSMLRLSNALETVSTLALAGKDQLFALADRGLRLLGYAQGRCLLVFGITGGRRMAHQAYRRAGEIFRAHGGLLAGRLIGRIWSKSRFRTPYLRNTLWQRGYALDTLESAVPWCKILPLIEAVLKSLNECLSGTGERVLAFAHLSHVYADGAGIYVTFLYRRAADPDETLQRWQVLKSAASQVIVSHLGTISHQHGVGYDHAPYLEAEKGALGIKMLKSLCSALDPHGLMNPGKLLG